MKSLVHVERRRRSKNRSGAVSSATQSSRPSRVPAPGCDVLELPRSRMLNGTPWTRADAAPMTTSSGVEYFIGIHLLPWWICESALARVQPALQLHDV